MSNEKIKDEDKLVNDATDDNSEISEAELAQVAGGLRPAGKCGGLSSTYDAEAAEETNSSGADTD